MALTIAIEEFAADTRNVFEQLLAAGEPVVLCRDGQPLAGMVPYSGDTELLSLTPQAKTELLDSFVESEAEVAGGHYLTLEELKEKYAHKLAEGHG
jgi:antitoxin (DNA-binding transcriptional repressor) of toxin-antitoxin stability system